MNTTAKRTFTLEEVEAHSTAESTWLAINGKVYDVTKYVQEHPGGLEVIYENAGKEATDEFEDVGHSGDAREILEGFYIGDLAQQGEEEKIPTAKKRGDGNSSSFAGIARVTAVVGLAVVASILIVKIIRR